MTYDPYAQAKRQFNAGYRTLQAPSYGPYAGGELPHRLFGEVYSKAGKRPAIIPFAEQFRSFADFQSYVLADAAWAKVRAKS